MEAGAIRKGQKVLVVPAGVVATVGGLCKL
jgi:hypothetical protein